VTRRWLQHEMVERASEGESPTARRDRTSATLLARRSSCRSARRSTRSTRRSTAFGTGGSTRPGWCGGEKSPSGSARTPSARGSRSHREPPVGLERTSESAIDAALALRLVFGLPWRQTEGLLRSLLRRLGLSLASPDHTTLSRRARSTRVRVPPRSSADGIHLVVDATGRMCLACVSPS
jgi:hypothetical protein